MKPIAVYARSSSPRLIYVLDWLFKDVLHTEYHILQSVEEAEAAPFLISYGKAFETAVSIPEAGLVFETGTRRHEITTGTWNSVPTLYHVNDNGHSIPFDLFSAIFFLISRYEEYYDFTLDKHGRYPPENSFLFIQGWLERPLIDEWICEFVNALNVKGNIGLSAGTYAYLPTYDIDIAYSYKHKGFLRSVGGMGEYLILGDLKRLQERAAVLAGNREDPYDSYAWMDRVHEEYQIKPIYFILAALKTTAFDKNISAGAKPMKALMRSARERGEIGMHPSYYSDVPSVFKAEKENLEKLSGAVIDKSRQHYIRLSIPATYHQLIAMGISEDFSMGYGSKLGFRAGTGRSFRWYDLSSEKETLLVVHPFSFMDTTARFEEGLEAHNAFERLVAMQQILFRTGSRLITIFHNFSLGSDRGWEGWKERYQQFLDKAVPRVRD